MFVFVEHSIKIITIRQNHEAEVEFFTLRHNFVLAHDRGTQTSRKGPLASLIFFKYDTNSLIIAPIPPASEHHL